jgi:hypothetical protein
MVGRALVPYFRLTPFVSVGEPREPMEPATPSPQDDRRQDIAVRRHVQQLLELIRDFYSTCHMVAVGQLSAAKAKEKALDVEQKVDDLMGDLLQRLDDTDKEASLDE